MIIETSRILQNNKELEILIVKPDKLQLSTIQDILNNNIYIEDENNRYYYKNKVESIIPQNVLWYELEKIEMKNTEIKELEEKIKGQDSIIEEILFDIIPSLAE